MSVEPRSRWLRRLAVVVAVALCALGGRAVAGVVAPSESGGNDTAAVMGADGEAPSGPAVAESDGTVVAVSEVTADEDWTHVQEPDVITFVDGPPLDAPESPASDGDPEPPAADDDAPEPGEGRDIDLDDVVVADDVAGELTVVPTLGVSVRVETLGHFARITVPVTAGDSAVTSLAIDFGDGTSLNADAEQLTQVANGRSLTVLHEFEPTLTFSRQRVEATVRDAEGEEKVASNAFITRVYYILSYSPLTVTSLNDCDTFGKGDFELDWNQDGRDRKSIFKLGAGESYVEPRFRNRIFGVFYDEPGALKFSLRENDPRGAFLLTPWKWDVEFFGRPASPRGEVAQFGDHHYEVSRGGSEGGIRGDSDCVAGARFTVHLDMVDDANQALQILEPPTPR